jgi:ribosomal protein S18 acetylase RimI-like enzyme
MDKITIRLAILDDVKNIKHLDDECFGMYKYDNYSVDLIKDILLQNISYVATIIENNIEKIIGFILLDIDDISQCDHIEMEHYMNLKNIKDFALIYSIGVSTNYRNCGVGSALLEIIKCDKFINMYEKIFLQVRKSNTSAINLYKKNGFIKKIILTNYYCEPNEDGILMEFSLLSLQDL